MARVFAVMAEFNALTECRGTKLGRKYKVVLVTKLESGQWRSGRDANPQRSQKVVQMQDFNNVQRSESGLTPISNLSRCRS